MSQYATGLCIDMAKRSICMWYSIWRK